MAATKRPSGDAAGNPSIRNPDVCEALSKASKAKIIEALRSH
ncbi:hypothetical protein [Hansschlegelia zhihuaiae]|nr:hypothetical protein [Hansschlegelia zhihuaiae]